MAGFDRTGPVGQGSMTGRKMGVCTGNDFLRNANFRFNQERGFGRGFQRRSTRNSGIGFGFRHGFGNRNFNVHNISDKTQIEIEIDTLKNQLAILEKQLLRTKRE